MQPHNHSKTPKIVQWVMRNSGGLIKNEQTATYLIQALSIIAIGLSIFWIFGDTTQERTPKEQQMIDRSLDAI